MSERREGWYWIMLDEGWEAAHWNGVSWVIIGSDLTASADNLRKIGPRIPEPDEPWQCVPVEPTDEMIEAGAQRLVNWPCDGLVWPDSWDALDVAAARNDAERVIRSALSAAPKLEDAE